MSKQGFGTQEFGVPQKFETGILVDAEQLNKVLSNLFDTAVDGIIIIDRKGLIEQFSKAAEDIFGYTASEVIGENIKLLMPPKEAERHDDYLAGQSFDIIQPHCAHVLMHLKKIAGAAELFGVDASQPLPAPSASH